VRSNTAFACEETPDLAEGFSQSSTARSTARLTWAPLLKSRNGPTLLERRRSASLYSRHREHRQQMQRRTERRSVRHPVGEGVHLLVRAAPFGTEVLHRMVMTVDMKWVSARQPGPAAIKLIPGHLQAPSQHDCNRPRCGIARGQLDSQAGRRISGLKALCAKLK
jgi:hypothetical protein